MEVDTFRLYLGRPFLHNFQDWVKTLFIFLARLTGTISMCLELQSGVGLQSWSRLGGSRVSDVGAGAGGNV